VNTRSSSDTVTHQHATSPYVCNTHITDSIHVAAASHFSSSTACLVRVLSRIVCLPYRNRLIARFHFVAHPVHTSTETRYFVGRTITQYNVYVKPLAGVG